MMLTVAPPLCIGIRDIFTLMPGIYQITYYPSGHLTLEQR